MDNKGPVLIGGILKELLKRYNLEKRINETKLKIDWKKITGEIIGQHTRLKDVKNGILFVEVENSIWMQELQMMKYDLIDRIREETENMGIKDILFFQTEKDNAKKNKKQEKLVE
jgi:predicted nucleic acid-binding Zn ribbon protein